MGAADNHASSKEIVYDGESYSISVVSGSPDSSGYGSGYQVKADVPEGESFDATKLIYHASGKGSESESEKSRTKSITDVGTAALNICNGSSQEYSVVIGEPSSSNNGY